MDYGFGKEVNGKDEYEETLMKKNTLFWDRVAFVYDIFVNVINVKTHRQLRREICDLIEPSDVVLECACGTGMLAEVIAPRCAKLIATDFSTKMLQKTEKKCKRFTNTTYTIANILDLNFETGSFDTVVAGNVVHLLRDPREALQELDRVCRPGGKIIIPTYINKDENNKENKFAKIAGKIGTGFKNKFTFDSYERFFIDAGYDDAKFITVEGKIPCSIAVIEKK